jgi:hypothetical protein
MTRTLLVRLIASAYIAKGLWDLGNFLSPFFSSPTSIPVEVFSLVGGIWEIYAGIYLFRIDETGRKLTVALSSIGMAVFAVVIFWALFFWADGYALTLNFLDEIIFKTEDRFVSAGIGFLFFAFPLFTILFLSQDKTRVLFAHEVVSNGDSKTPVESP